MLRPFRLFLIALAVVVVGAGAFVAWYVFSDDAPAKPSLPEVQTAASDRTSPDGTWSVAPGKDVYLGYRMQEQFGGETVKKDAVGRTPAVTGSMTIEHEKVTAGSVSADLRELESGRAARDRYLHDNSLQTDTIPNTTFTLTQPIDLGQVRQGTEQKLEVAGTLKLHDVERPVQLTVDARWTGDRIDVAGTVPIVLADYQIATPKTPIVSVADHGSLELQLVFHPA
jgi:polyisoprenoid-binding protein YceI